VGDHFIEVGAGLHGVGDDDGLFARKGRYSLAESDCTVRTAAELLGYPDPYTFSKQFKAVRGYPPSRNKKP